MERVKCPLLPITSIEEAIHVGERLSGQFDMLAGEVLPNVPMSLLPEACCHIRLGDSFPLLLPVAQLPCVELSHGEYTLPHFRT